MGETKYCIKDELGNKIAENMDIKIAALLIEAMFHRYRDESGMELTIGKMTEKECENNGKY